MSNKFAIAVASVALLSLITRSAKAEPLSEEGFLSALHSCMAKETICTPAMGRAVDQVLSACNGVPLAQCISRLNAIAAAKSRNAGVTVMRGNEIEGEPQSAERRVAADAVRQYRIAEGQGDQMQICVQVGFVAAAFLQAKDEINYRIWKETERQRCRAAGLPY